MNQIFTSIETYVLLLLCICDSRIIPKDSNLQTNYIISNASRYARNVYRFFFIFSTRIKDIIIYDCNRSRAGIHWEPIHFFFVSLTSNSILSFQWELDKIDLLLDISIFIISHIKHMVVKQFLKMREKDVSNNVVIFLKFKYSISL